MYLRTPKRYRAKHRRHLNLISRRTVFLLLLTVLLAGLGWMVWTYQDQVRSEVAPVIGDAVEEVVSSARTQVAPAPTPTATPNVELARAGCINGFRQGDLDNAVEQCTILAQNNPNDIDLHFQITQTLIFHDRLDDALRFADMTINANPEAPHGWAVRALALDWKGEIGPALAAALHAKSLDANFGFAYAVLGEVYHDMGRDDAAIAHLDQAVALAQGNRSAQSQRTLAYAFRMQGKMNTDQGLYEEAIEYYQRAWELAPTDTYIAIELALNYIALQDVDSAQQILAAATEQNPNDPALLFNWGKLYVNSGNNERAYEYFRRCLEAYPDYAPCLSWLGGLYYSEGDYETAIPNLQRAIELGSTDPDDFYQIGHALASLNRCAIAHDYLIRGYEIALEREDARRQALFINQFQSCNLPLPQAALVTPTPEAPTPTLPAQ